VDPRILRHFGDKCIDHRPPLRLGIDGGKMRLRHHLTHQRAGLAGVDEVVDDEESLAGTAADLRGLLRNALEHLQILRPSVAIARAADSTEAANAKLARNDAGRPQPAAGNCDNGVEWSPPVQPPGPGPAIAAKPAPRLSKGFPPPLLGAQ